jgi:hypothetical protein
MGGWSVVSITPRPRFTPGERTPGIHWIIGRVRGEIRLASAGDRCWGGGNSKRMYLNISRKTFILFFVYEYDLFVPNENWEVSEVRLLVKPMRHVICNRLPCLTTEPRLWGNWTWWKPFVMLTCAAWSRHSIQPNIVLCAVVIVLLNSWSVLRDV